MNKIGSLKPKQMSKDELILEAFKAGQVEGLAEFGQKPEFIQTGISYVFLFPTTVYKLCRKDNENFKQLFVDLGQGQGREDLYRKDFFTNHYFSPTVYRRLLRIKVVEDKVSVVPENEAGEDLVMEMRRINTEQNLTSLLKAGTLAAQDFEQMGYEMTKAIAEFPGKPQTTQNYYEIMKYFVDDLRDFAYLSEKFMSRADIDRVIAVLYDLLEKKKALYEKIGEADFINSIDNHSDNIFYDQDQVSLIDSYIIKDSWRIVEPIYAIYRPATDVAVWQGDEMKKALISGWSRFYQGVEIDADSDRFYQIYFALIRAGLFYQMYQETGAAKVEADRYWAFINPKAGIN